MNKISKKIVALATMAAFVLTLVPAAAFAADDSKYVSEGVDIQKSGIHAIVNGQTVDSVDVAPGEDVTISFEINDENGVSASINPDDTQDIPLTPAEYAEKVKIWAVDNETQQVTTALVMDKNNECALTQDNVYKLLAPVWDGNTLTVSFNKEGNYTVYAGVGDFGEGGSLDTVAKLTASSVSVNVEDDAVVDEIAFDNDYIVWDKNNPTVGDLNLIKDPSFDADGIQKYNLKVITKINDKPAASETITVTADSKALTIENADADSETDGVQIVTNNRGEATITFRMNDNRNVPITISAGDVSYTLKLINEVDTAYDIDTVEDGGYVLAGSDWAKYGAQNVLTNAVQYSIADIKGDALTGKLDGEPAFGFTGAKVSIESKPGKSTLDAKDLALYWDEANGVYTLVYNNAKDNDPAKDLIPGEYTVRVGLNSADYTDATFTVAKFGTVEDVVLSMEATDMSTGRVTAIDDEVTLGQIVEVTAKYVDGNGIMVDADTAIDFGANGKAVQDVNFGWDVNGFTTKADVASNESLIGTTITVTAYSQKYKTYVEKELTVVDSYNAFGLEFDPAEGPVNEDNDVTVKVVKEDGSVAQVDGQLMAYVADQSNEDAVVTVDVDKWVKDGKGELTVYASEPTTVDIVVAVKDSSNQGLYAATLEYTAGKEDITAHHNVVMTIGSSEYVVDKQLFTMDAAPYVDSNWRTMVPIRALAEAFDATVTYDNDDRTVTIEYNEETIVMTVDDATYTVNGVEGEMDTEAVIKGDRTYVPIRFAAEAMGFTVTALYDENSSTASVVFQS